MKKDYSILIGGEAGQGSRKAGLIIAKIFNQMGYNVFIHDDYQSLIKGGHSFSQIRASDEECLTHSKKVDFILALDKKTIEKHKAILNKGGIIISGERPYEIVKELNGNRIMGNIAMIAIFSKHIGIDWKTLSSILKKEISRDIEKNLEIAKKAYNETKELFKIEKIKKKVNPLVTGNEAIALGAIDAGLDIYSAYPMTPATSILHYLAEKRKTITTQAENEIAVINSIIGSAYAGKRSMTGTSGGGFALMTEAISFASIAEIPILVVNSQRAGPASGVPTYSAQGDLLFSLNSGHGDIVRFVASPGDANEAYYLSGTLLNLAWKYQTPAILLADKELSESTYEFYPKKIKKEKELLWDNKGEYERYAQTENGISPMAYPGKTIVKATSYEHDRKGYTTEDAETIIAMQDKRLRKFKEMEKALDELETVKVYGNKKSKKAVICWGSTKGAVKEASWKLGLKVIQILFLQPFPIKELKKALKGVDKLVSVECNSTGQLSVLLSQNGIKVDKQILKYDARPFNPEDLELKLKKI
ncbi:MAG TPA: 2-oxoacid:acceptor oxidoreductase subunit alpha [Candidatus Pacearchaeota archaeon]|nr:2-oxoacid:acceptor oxidoreductase subunit alpha [Candidatus Pacearchaeota archaeon]